MKKFVLAAITASILAGPIAAVPASAAAQQRRVVTRTVRHVPGRTVVVKRTVTRPAARPTLAQRNWRRGERFDYRQAHNYGVISDYRGHHLNAPPRGYRYVRSGNDAVLVGISSGVVAAVIAGALR